MLRLILKRFLWIASIAYGLVLVFLSLCSFWPLEWVWMANLLLAIPSIVFVIPVVVLALLCLCLLDARLILFQVFLAGLLVVGVLGFSMNFTGLKSAPKPAGTIRVVTVNTGDTQNLSKLAMFLEEAQPDVVSLQEFDSTQQGLFKNVFSLDGWHWFVNGNLGVLSRFPILNGGVKTREAAGGEGTMANRVVLETPQGKVYFFNVHLETPRKAFELSVDNRRGVVQEMRNFTNQQNVESLIISKWVAERRPAIVAGDFNMLRNHPVFRKYWGNLTNAFSRAGWGFGFTKVSRYYSARVDHICADQNWLLKQAWVGPDVDSDHYPVVADFELVKVSEMSESPTVESSQKNPREFTQQQLEGAFVYESFELDLGNFEPSSEAMVSLDSGAFFSGDSSLRLEAKSFLDIVSANRLFSSWSIERSPNASFSYRIPSGVSAVVRVKTSLNDWICIAKTQQAVCPEAGTAAPVVLTDDDQWHSADIDVRSQVQSLLPSIKYLSGWEWQLLPGVKIENVAWFDDLVIF